MATRNGENPIKSNIYYIKMSQPTSNLSGVFSDMKAYDAGKNLSNQRCQQPCGNIDNCNDNAENCSCKEIKSDFIKEKDGYKNLYAYKVKNYNDHINYNYKTKIKFLNLIGKVVPFFSYKFTHTTTSDQSFFSDQLEAFVRLGYLQTIDMKK